MNFLAQEKPKEIVEQIVGIPGLRSIVDNFEILVEPWQKTAAAADSRVCGICCHFVHATLDQKLKKHASLLSF